MRYDLNDEATFYVIYNNRDVVAYTDIKELAKAYLSISNNKNLKCQVVEGLIQDIRKNITEINYHSEIKLRVVNTFDNKKEKSLMVPMTKNDEHLFSDNLNNYLYQYIDYYLLSTMVPYLKSKYNQALSSLLLPEVIDSVIYGKHSDSLLNDVKLDEVKLFASLFH